MSEEINHKTNKADQGLKNRENKSWYAVYTRPRFEKKVFNRLEEQGIQAYLPLQKKLKQWSDRKKWVEQPLFTSYVFVKIDRRDYDRVLKTDGVVAYVSFEGKAAKIRQEEIDTLKLLVDSNVDLENIDKRIKPGENVVVTEGALKDLQGELVRINKQKKFIIRIHSLHQNLLVEVPGAFVKSTKR